MDKNKLFMVVKDSNGCVTREPNFAFDSSCNHCNGVIERKYDEQGREIETVLTSNHIIIVKTFSKYDDNGNIIELRNEDLEDSSYSYTIYAKYNENNQILSSETVYDIEVEENSSDTTSNNATTAEDINDSCDEYDEEYVEESNDDDEYDEDDEESGNPDIVKIEFEYNPDGKTYLEINKDKLGNVVSIIEHTKHSDTSSEKVGKSPDGKFLYKYVYEDISDNEFTCSSYADDGSLIDVTTNFDDGKYKYSFTKNPSGEIIDYWGIVYDSKGNFSNFEIKGNHKHSVEAKSLDINSKSKILSFNYKNALKNVLFFQVLPIVLPLTLLVVLPTIAYFLNGGKLMPELLVLDFVFYLILGLIWVAVVDSFKRLSLYDNYFLAYKVDTGKKTLVLENCDYSFCFMDNSIHTAFDEYVLAPLSINFNAITVAKFVKNDGLFSVDWLEVEINHDEKLRLPVNKKILNTLGKYITITYDSVLHKVLPVRSASLFQLRDNYIY